MYNDGYTSLYMSPTHSSYSTRSESQCKQWTFGDVVSVCQCMSAVTNVPLWRGILIIAEVMHRQGRSHMGNLRSFYSICQENLFVSSFLAVDLWLIIARFTKFLLRAENSYLFHHVQSWTPTYKAGMIISILLKRKWDLERLSNLPKVTVIMNSPECHYATYLKPPILTEVSASSQVHSNIWTWLITTMQ